MEPRIRAVIFDLDGTLLDHVGSVTNALRHWLPTLGAEPEALVAAWFAAEEQHLPAWQARQISFAEQRRRRLRDFLPLLGTAPGGDNELDAVFAGYLACYEAAWTKFGDVDVAPTELGGRIDLRVAVLTNGTMEQQTAKLRAVGLDGLLGAVFTAEALGAAKPDPRTYLTVCGELGVNPQSAVHVGDRYDLDVAAPRAAGLRAVYLDRHNAGPSDERHRITSLLELPRELDRLGS